MSADGQGTKRRRNIAEKYNRLSRVHERYRQKDGRQTDGRQHIANVNMSSRSLETFVLLILTSYIYDVSGRPENCLIRSRTSPNAAYVTYYLWTWSVCHWSTTFCRQTSACLCTYEPNLVFFISFQNEWVRDCNPASAGCNTSVKWLDLDLICYEGFTVSVCTRAQHHHHHHHCSLLKVDIRNSWHEWVEAKIQLHNR